MYKLVIGLANPGRKYQNARHNLGSVLINRYAQKHSIKLSNKTNLQAKVGQIRVGESKIILAIPTTYMNMSGQSVYKLANFYKISPENIYIAHDDLDIGVGESKIQFGRGPAGHNGIKSIIENLGTQEFWRIRIGTDHPQDNVSEEDYVLKPPTKEEKGKIDQTIDKIVNQLNQTLGL